MAVALGQGEVGTSGLGAVLTALETRDRYSGRHWDAVLELSVAVGRQIGLPESRLERLAQLALLHDLGKLGLPDSVLGKQGRLSPAERLVMERHPEIGAQMVAGVPGLSHLAPAIRAEHERWDGSGYPDGLEGEDIPLESQIVFACDAYHAMCSPRPYRPALSPTKAMRELRAGRGRQFAPGVVDALLSVLCDVISTPDGRWRFVPGSAAADPG
jgi:HD-GYP domain-containing protein (c-di-GMP phosphodiesterase class II)